MKSQKLARLLPVLAGLGLLYGSPNELIAQTTYTYNGSAWSDGLGTVSGPALGSSNSLVLNAGSFSIGSVYSTATGSVIGNSYNPGQTFTATASGSIQSISVRKLQTGNSGLTFILKIYSSVGGTLLKSVSFSTTSDYIQTIDLGTPLAVTAGTEYYFYIDNNGNPWSFQWARAGGNPYSGGTFVNDGTVDSWFDFWFIAKYVSELQDVTVSNGATLNVPIGSLLAHGDLVVDGSVNLSASSTGYSQLKVDGTVSGTGSVVQNMYVSGTGYHALASSMSGGFGTTSASTGGLYSYNASTGAYDFSPSLSAAGMGYFGLLGTGGFVSGAGTFSVSGTPNTSHTHSLGYASTVASGGSGNGWNLVGNPYTCALDWTAVTKSSGVNNAFYIWNPAISTYDYYVSGVTAPTGTYAGSSIASPYVAPLQAFWVQTTSAGQTLTSTMATAGTVAASPSYYKTLADQLILLVREVGDSSKADALWIKDVASSSSGFDASEDAWKMGNYGGQPSLSIASLDGLMAVNALPVGAGTTVDVQFSAPVAGRKYAMELQVPQGEFNVLLEDRATGTFTDLTTSGYSFTDGVCDGPRFALHLATTALETSNQELGMWSFVGAEGILLHGAPAGTVVQLLSVDGRVLDRAVATEGATRLAKPVAQGMYLLRCAEQTLKILVP